MEEKQGFFAPGQNTVQIYSVKDDWEDEYAV